MNDDYQVEVNRLIATAGGKSDGDVALLDEAARLADTHGDVPLGIKVRLKLMEAANGAGNQEVVLVAFTWSLAQIDRDEDVRAKFERRVLWYYKWAIQSLSEYAQVSRRQIESSFADMADRYTRAGHGMGAVHKCKACTSIRLGDVDAHRDARERWTRAPRDGISDCAACQTHAGVEFDIEFGDLDAAVRRADPIIRGRQSCIGVPTSTFGPMLLPLVARGDVDLAEQFHRRTIRPVLASREFTATIGDHCAYLAVRGRFTKAIQAFETGMSWVMELRRTWDRMLFLQNAVVVFERLAAARDEPLRLKVPESAPFYRDDHTYEPAAVAEALRRMHAERAAELDQRNGNAYMQQRHQRFRELVASLPRSTQQGEDERE